jgi:hypothetical protein
MSTVPPELEDGLVKVIDVPSLLSDQEDTEVPPTDRADTPTRKEPEMVTLDPPVLGISVRLTWEINGCWVSATDQASVTTLLPVLSCLSPYFPSPIEIIWPSEDNA